MAKLSFTALVFFQLFILKLQAQTIDFEDGSFTEGTELYDQYSGTSCGVKFYMGSVSDDNHPVIATVGANNGANGTAFNGVNRSEAGCGVSTSTVANMPADGENLGCKFLSVTPNFTPETLNIVYDANTLYSSGDLIDVDGNEEWTITAHSEILTDSPVGTPVVISGNGNSDNNGKASFWEIDLETENTPFIRIEIKHTGTSTSVGLALDNLSSCSVTSVDGTNVGEDQVSLFPNPAYKTVTVSNSSDQKISEILLYNQLGVLVKAISGENISQFDVTNLSPGIYLVEFRLEASSFVKKLIVD